MLSKEEATLFQDLCRYIVAERFILKEIEPCFSAGANGGLDDAVRLADAGLLNPDLQLKLVQQFKSGEPTFITMSDICLQVTSQNAIKNAFPAFVLTGAGTELARLFRAPADRAHAAALVAEYRRRGYQVATHPVVRTHETLSVNSDVDLFPLTHLDAAAPRSVSPEPDRDPRSETNAAT